VKEDWEGNWWDFPIQHATQKSIVVLGDEEILYCWRILFKTETEGWHNLLCQIEHMEKEREVEGWLVKTVEETVETIGECEELERRESRGREGNW